MFNYIKADLYRLFHKTSNRVYWSVLAGAFVLMMVLNGSNFSGPSNEITEFYYSTAGMALLSLGAIVICPQVYSTVYLDDYTSRNSVRVFSSGLGKSQYLLAKIIVTVCYMIGVLLFLTLSFLAGFGLLALLNHGLPFFDKSQIIFLISEVGFLILFTVAFSALTNVITINIQSGTVPLLLFFLFSSGMFASFIHLVMKLPILKNINVDPVLLSTNTDKLQTALMNMSGLMGGQSTSVGAVNFEVGVWDVTEQIRSIGARPFLVIGGYLIVTTLVTWFLLNKKDIKEI